MSVYTHETSVVSKGARLDESVKVGPYSIIEDGVTIGERTEISSFCLIRRGTVIGRDCRIFHGAVIGELPQETKQRGGGGFCWVGNGNTIREYVTIHRATDEDGATVVGDGNYLMAYVHVAHNCKIGSGVTIANATNIAGWVEIEDYAVISGLCPVHQWVRIGTHAMIGGGYRVPKDVPPYCLAAGDPLRVRGLNLIGLRRHGFPKETLSILKEAYRILFRAKLNTSQALESIANGLPQIEEIEHLVQFIEGSKRGIVKG